MKFEKVDVMVQEHIDRKIYSKRSDWMLESIKLAGLLIIIGILDVLQMIYHAKPIDLVIIYAVLVIICIRIIMHSNAYLREWKHMEFKNDL